MDSEKKKEEAKVGKEEKFFKKNSYLVAGVTLVLAGSFFGINLERYSVLAEAEVIEERKIEGDKKQNYLLYVKIIGNTLENELGNIYTLNVNENPKMPLEVLDHLIGPGTKIFFPYLKDGIFSPQLAYPVARFGSIDSLEIKVVSPWLTSEEVKRRFEKEIKDRTEKEHKDSLSEAFEYYHSTTIF